MGKNLKTKITESEFIRKEDIIDLLKENKNNLLRIKCKDISIWVKGLIILNNGYVTVSSFLETQQIRINNITSVIIGKKQYMVILKGGTALGNAIEVDKETISSTITKVLENISLSKTAHDADSLKFYKDTLIFIEDIIKTKKVKFKEEGLYLELITRGKEMI